MASVPPPGPGIPPEQEQDVSTPPSAPPPSVDESTGPGDDNGSGLYVQPGVSTASLVAISGPHRSSIVTRIRRLSLPSQEHLSNIPRDTPSPFRSRALSTPASTIVGSLSTPSLLFLSDNITALPPTASSPTNGEKATTTDASRPGESTPLAYPENHKPFFSRIYARLRATYCPRGDPPLILPTCPTDAEKQMYAHTNRALLYVVGAVSFLSLCAGQWLFAVSTPVFSWYAVWAAAMLVYLGVSYAVGIIGRDWDEGPHGDALARFDQRMRDDDAAPSVDVFLPCCGEPLDVLANTYEHVARLEWPASRLLVHVLDDGADPSVGALAAKYGFSYVVRGDRPRLRKAGNLRWAFARTGGVFFAIFDADFCPRPDFLRELMCEHLEHPNTAIVQSPQFFRVVPEQTWVEQGAGATQELFYRVVQVNRNRWGASICVGSNALYRRAALEEVGGTAEIGFSEDVHTGFNAVDRGWEVRYLPLCLATGVCPASPRAFFSQQMRWARGSTTLGSNPRFWKSNLTFIQKLCYLSGFLYYVTVSFNIFLAPIPGTMLLGVRPDYFKFWNLAFAIPSILYGVVVMRVWARASYGFNVQHVMTIQNYAYLTAIKDRIFGVELLWAASGDKKVHSSSHKYRNMRLLCIVWGLTVFGAMAGVVAWRIATGFPWWDTVPLMVISVYNLWINHYFMVCNW